MVLVDPGCLVFGCLKPGYSVRGERTGIETIPKPTRTGLIEDGPGLVSRVTSEVFKGGRQTPSYRPSPDSSANISVPLAVHSGASGPWATS